MAPGEDPVAAQHGGGVVFYGKFTTYGSCLATLSMTRRANNNMTRLSCAMNGQVERVRRAYHYYRCAAHFLIAITRVWRQHFSSVQADTIRTPRRRHAIRVIGPASAS